MQTQRHQERVQQRDDDGEDERSMGVHPGQANTELVACPDAQRSDEEGGQGTDDDHAEERDEDQLHAFGDDLLQSVVDDCQHGGHEQRHEHVAGVVAQQHRQTEDLRRAGGGAQSIIGGADGVGEGLVSIRLVNCGVMSMPMIAPPSHGSTFSFLAAL